MNKSKSITDEQEGAAPSAASGRWSSRVFFVVGVAIAVAIFFWLIKGIVENWDELSVNLSQVSLWTLAVALAIHLGFILFIGLCYYNSLRLAGARVRVVAAVSVYLASQLGKYIPGKVFYVAGQITLAKWLRISIAQSVLGFTAHHVQLVAAGLMIACPLPGISLSREVVAVLIALSATGFLILASGVWIKPFNAFQRKRHKPEIANFSPIYAIRAVLSAGVGWILYGCVAAVLAVALVPESSPATFVRVGMAAVAAWLLGFLSFITPAGMGVREGAFVLLTRAIIPEPTAMTVALIMRLIYSGLQVPIGAMALAYSMRGRS